MFQSLASYFYGSPNDSDQPAATTTTTTMTTMAGDQLMASARLDESAMSVERQPRLVTKPCDEHDDEAESDEVSDWLLVDKEDSPAPTDSEDEIPFVRIKNAPALPAATTTTAPQQRRGAGGRHSRQHSSGAGTHDGLLGLQPAALLPSSMDESWFVTPPPCFTSRGPPAGVEMSPFENLLIEHPSMSVYHSMRHSQSGGGGGLAEAGKADAVLEDVIVVGLTAGGQGVVVATAAAAPVHPAADRSPGHTVRVRGNGNAADGGRGPSVSHRTLKQLLAANTPKSHSHSKTAAATARNALDRGNKVAVGGGCGGKGRAAKRSDTSGKVLQQPRRINTSSQRQSR